MSLNSISDLSRRLACAIAGAAFVTSIAAQCTTQWRSDGPFQTVSAQVWSMAVWDVDGAGPLSAQVVAGRGGSGTGAVVAWDEQSASWQTLGTLNGRPLCMLATAGGELLVGGDFTSVDGVAVSRLARFDGVSWSSVGGGVTFAGLQAYVYALSELPGGEVAVGGFFSQAGGVAAANIARWDGSGWSAYGVGANGDVRALLQLPDGSLIAGGSFSQMGGVSASKVARWHGGTWSPFGTGLSSSVRDLARLADGTVIAANGDTFVLSGATWTIVPGNSDYQTAVAVLPDGDLVTGGISGSLRRFDGTSWTPIGPATSGACNELLLLPNGDVAAGGQFWGAGGVQLPSLMALTTTCEAVVADLGGGCQGTIAASLPWAGSVVETSGTGLPASSIVVVVHGFSPVSLGLDAVFATGAPGCLLQAAPDVLGVLLPIGGVAAASLTLSDSPAVAGVQLREQWVAFELTSASDFGPITATNALALTIGSF